MPSTPSLSRLFLHSLIATTLWLLLLPTAFVYDVWIALPDSKDKQAFLASQSIVITDRDNGELYRLFAEEDRVQIDVAELPPYVPLAFLAIEDERFGERTCVDVRAIGRAVLANVSDYKSQGASTITQQLVRTAMLTPEKTIRRKLSELILACQLEHRFSRNEILSLYLNWIPFGSNVYGIEQASQLYFGVPAVDLSIAQTAVLASLPQRPTYFSPYGPHRQSSIDPATVQGLEQDAITLSNVPTDSVQIGLLPSRINTASGALWIGGRSSQVLANMERLGWLSKPGRESAELQLRSLEFSPPVHRIEAPHFVFWVREELLKLDEEAALRHKGLRVKTTLDPLLQQEAELLIEQHLPRLQTEFGANHVALLAVDRRTREVLAYVGNANYFDEQEGQVDMIQAPRQPGSSFKPIVYAAAFQNGVQANTVVYDAPVRIGEYSPRNYDGGYFGKMNIRQALGHSRNIPALKAFYWAGGEESLLQFAARLGAHYPLEQKERLKREFPGSFRYGWPLTLGSAEVPLFQMVQSYTTLANNGQYLPLRGIRTIRDADGQLLPAPFYKGAPEQVVQAQSALQITSILSDPGARPEGFWRDQLTVNGIEAAVKTGTSSKCIRTNSAGSCQELAADNTWVLGYTPEMVVGVWIGNANGSALYPEANGLVAGSPLWRTFVERVHTVRSVEQRGFFAQR